MNSDGKNFASAIRQYAVSIRMRSEVAFSFSPCVRWEKRMRSKKIFTVNFWWLDRHKLFKNSHEAISQSNRKREIVCWVALVTLASSCPQAWHSTFDSRTYVPTQIRECVIQSNESSEDPPCLDCWFLESHKSRIMLSAPRRSKSKKFVPFVL